MFRLAACTLALASPSPASSVRSPYLSTSAPTSGGEARMRRDSVEAAVARRFSPFPAVFRI